jgi:hypothetical protein
MSLDGGVAFVHALVATPFVTAQTVSADDRMHLR